MATEKQVRYLFALLRQSGYRTDYMCAAFKALGAKCSERSGTVEGWLSGLNQARVSDLIKRLGG